MACKKQVKRMRKSFHMMTRFFTQLMREQVSCGPVTVQQCYALEGLSDGPRTMNQLALYVGLHQSTLTRIVEKLEKMKFVERKRKSDNQRVVEVQITESGQMLYEYLDKESNKMTAALLEKIPESKRKSVVESMEIVAEILNPEGDCFQDVMKVCCSSKRE